ncbi:hypothetical protein K2173_023415 [Erythroxylum novogranatense]|uniref:Uncharacterized protein n=1 Tax=Erythroxylum novogranatense TaxID=1862640 RepID=A0AAV8TZ23_9ROSI|nr:hypothetical protein K2173_023415 [Erythroxylum novogranatense]
MDEEDSVLNARKRFKTASGKTNIQGNKKEDDKRVKQERRKVVAPNPPPDLPQEFKNRIGEMEGREVTLVIQKALFETDLKKGEGRLSIPANQIQSHNFLTDEEKESLNKLDEQGKLKAIEAKLIGPDAAQETTIMNFKKWNMKKSNGRRYTFIEELTLDVQNVVAPPKQKSSLVGKATSSTKGDAKESHLNVDLKSWERIQRFEQIPCFSRLDSSEDSAFESWVLEFDPFRDSYPGQGFPKL